MKKNLIISAVVAIILAAGLGTVIYRDYKSGKSGGSASNTASTTTSGDIDTLVKEGKITVEEVPVQTNIPTPSLNRSIPSNSDISSETRNRLVAQMNDIISRIKNGSDSFDDWLGLGILRKQLGDYEGAAEAWEYVSVFYPDEAVPFGNLGDLYENFLKNYPKAEKNMLTVIRLNPSRVDGYRALYELYNVYYKEKASYAPKVLLDGLKANPGNYDLLILLANYYRDNGDHVKAKNYYEQALVVAEKNGEPWRADAIKEEIQKITG